MLNLPIGKKILSPLHISFLCRTFAAVMLRAGDKRAGYAPVHCAPK